ncbi:hypothetical protein [Novosphingobium album (ex Liu et al. 2023)]|uniref:Uncharacterized protein n=1 Tax=Novosphingobium album (ex Liu et al. 2023) TaxID=3031130 RepID=A0ABT5WWH0_9SPHN|nr:hypothetical protein [Novosphingobium album (ex Liu et al. 2023)]MDE8654250.1 hypothetical protein [Novosphingobium album (ex Liu et al. 2023)]
MNTSSLSDVSTELLRARRQDIAAAMARYLAEPDAIEPSAEDNQAANSLVDAMIASFSDPDAAAKLLAAHPVSRPYYAQFGDGLTPILRDVMGEAADPSFLSRSVDGYWRAVRSLPA